MGRRLIDKLYGAGQVYDDNAALIGDATYALRIYQEFREVRTKDGVETLDTLKHIEGRVRGLDNMRLILAGAALTLKLNDGRQLRFQIADQDGHITALGGLE